MSIVFAILFFAAFAGMLAIVVERLNNRRDGKEDDKLTIQLFYLSIGASAALCLLVVVNAMMSGADRVPVAKYEEMTLERDSLQLQIEEMSAEFEVLSGQLLHGENSLENAEALLQSAESREAELKVEIDVLAQSLITLQQELDKQKTRVQELEAAASSQAEEQARQPQASVVWISLRQSQKIYHTDPDCDAGHNLVPVLWELLDSKDYRPCEECARG